MDLRDGIERFGPARDVLNLVAQNVRETRLRLGWSQRELEKRSGVPQSQISRLERGRLSAVRLTTIDRLFRSLGVRYRITIEPPRFGQRLQEDLVHARCSAYAGRRLARAGWSVAREVEVGDDRSRGWIDLLAFNPQSRQLLVLEVKTEIHDVGQVERTMNWYQREARRSARRIGWAPRWVGAALLVLFSDANEDVILANRDVMAASFPGRASGLMDVISGPNPRRSTDVRHLALIDPRSHRAHWIRATRLDGRRTHAPYRDYIDAARAMGSRRPR